MNDDETICYYKLHSVLTYKMENNRLGCINRDRNAVLNMKKIVKSWLTDKTRPEKFRRGKNKKVISKKPVPKKIGTVNKKTVTRVTKKNIIKVTDKSGSGKFSDNTNSPDKFQ